MAKQSDAVQGSRFASVNRPHSHRVLEGLLLLCAFGLLLVLALLFGYEIHKILTSNPNDTAPETALSPSSVEPPVIESRVVGSELLLISKESEAERIIYRSDLSDDIADFTLFAIPQSGYQGFIYVRPIVDSDLPQLKVYPLEVTSGTLKAATISVSTYLYMLSDDQTLVATVLDNSLSIFALEDGTRIAQTTLTPAWQSLTAQRLGILSFDQNACATLTSPTTSTEPLIACPSL